MGAFTNTFAAKFMHQEELFCLLKFSLHVTKAVKVMSELCSKSRRSVKGSLSCFLAGKGGPLSPLRGGKRRRGVKGMKLFKASLPPSPPPFQVVPLSPQEKEEKKKKAVSPIFCHSDPKGRHTGQERGPTKEFVYFSAMVTEMQIYLYLRYILFFLIRLVGW